MQKPESSFDIFLKNSFLLWLAMAATLISCTANIFNLSCIISVVAHATSSLQLEDQLISFFKAIFHAQHYRSEDFKHNLIQITLF